MKTTRLSAFILLLVAALAAPFPAHAVETASQIIAKCAAKVSAAPSLKLKFTLQYGDKSSPCDITVAKQKYRLSSPEMEVWYDGNTQWTYAVAQRELSITEPTADELLECNPFAILNHYAKVYTCRRLSGNGNDIELTAKSSASTVRKAVVTVDPKTYMPQKLVVTLSNGRTFSAVVGTVTTGKNLPASYFTYDKAKYPASETVDLR